MASRLNPYLSFRDNAREAMEFYRLVFGGELMLVTYAEGGMSANPAEGHKIMHGQLETPNGFTLMGSDTPAAMEFRPGTTIAVSLSGDDEAELRGYWEKLSGGATVMLPLNPAPWGDQFGMLSDRFGVPWMVNIAGKRA